MTQSRSAIAKDHPTSHATRSLSRQQPRSSNLFIFIQKLNLAPISELFETELEAGEKDTPQ